MVPALTNDLTGARKEVYRYVERHGPTTSSTIAETMGIDSDELGQVVRQLRDEGLITMNDDASIEPAVDAGDAAEHREEGTVFTIRPATPGDYDAVLDLARSVATEAPYVTAARFAADLEYEETLNRRTPTRARAVFVATVGDDVVGWTNLAERTVQGVDTPVRLTLGVEESYRGTGIGSHLLQRGIEWAASRDAHEVYNSVPATNDAALDFLLKQGCEVEAVRPDHYRMDGDLVDEVHVARRLDR